MERTKRLSKLFIFLLCINLATSFLNEASNIQNRKNRSGVVYWHGDTEQKKIALTFDDGPSIPCTLQILKILKKYNVKATFFVIGKNVERYPLVAQKIVQDGHCIGNHTYTHPELLINTKSHIRHQIKKAEEIILEKTGIKPILFRPPYGIINPSVLFEAEKLGYVVVGWSVSGRNGIRELPSNKIIKKVLFSTQNGSIILLHDGNRLVKKVNRNQTLKALPVIIEKLKKQGYQFVTVPQLLNLK
ncbi:MAG: polysaccharide deacetylase family protein [Candidatus Omnitrophica bacterium]|nr:polysaccharide deacetylase family protein [Candidatus Omnitrophota bacterium]MCM8831667.1 polysaccharide deacetylase family protein [Candidatus Omnitrophota bacterium]